MAWKTNCDNKLKHPITWNGWNKVIQIATLIPHFTKLLPKMVDPPAIVKPHGGQVGLQVFTHPQVSNTTSSKGSVSNQSLFPPDGSCKGAGRESSILKATRQQNEVTSQTTRDLRRHQSNNLQVVAIDNCSMMKPAVQPELSLKAKWVSPMCISLNTCFHRESPQAQNQFLRVICSFLITLEKERFCPPFLTVFSISGVAQSVLPHLRKL